MQLPNQKAARQSTWRELINLTQPQPVSFTYTDHLMMRNGDISNITDTWLDRPFPNDWGCAPPEPFYIWTKNWVYFPVTYDGVTAVARIPCRLDETRPPETINAAQLVHRVFQSDCRHQRTTTEASQTTPKFPPPTP